MASERKDGGPVFPTLGEVFTTDAQGRTLPQSAWGIEGSPGMSLRDYFAGQALAGMLAYPGDDRRGSLHNNGTPIVAAEYAYSYADAMLAAKAAEEES